MSNSGRDYNRTFSRAFPGGQLEVLDRFRAMLSVMRRPTKTTLLAAALAIACVATPAANAQRAFTSGGHGNVECGKYLQYRADRADADTVVAWTWGYMTAYNQWSTHPQINQFPADHTVLAYLDKHCRDNPLDTVLQGIIALVADMGGFRPPPRNKR